MGDSGHNIGVNWYNGDSSQVPNAKIGEIMLLDSTMREGEQSPGTTFSLRQRLQLAWMLDYVGVDGIEISPIVSRDHEDSCRKIMKAGLNATIVIHIRSLRQDVDVALGCDPTWIAMYHSVSDIHLEHKLRISRETALERAVDVVEYAKSHGLKIRFTMEDASRADPAFLQKMCKAVAKAGVDRISIPDTLGVLRPNGMYNLIKNVRESVETPLDLHCHNDLGLALANSLAGIEAGASQIHVTVDGLGERVGITSIAEVVIALNILYGLRLNIKQEMLKELSDVVSNYTGVRTPVNMPIVGENAYKHKAGTHIAAMIRNSSAYELIPPKSVGNKRRIIFGELSGKNGAAYLLKVLGLNPSLEDSINLAQGLKSLHKGDLFELVMTDELESKAVRVDEEINKVKREDEYTSLEQGKGGEKIERMGYKEKFRGRRKGGE